MFCLRCKAALPRRFLRQFYRNIYSKYRAVQPALFLHSLRTTRWGIIRSWQHSGGIDCSYSPFDQRRENVTTELPRALPGSDHQQNNAYLCVHHVRRFYMFPQGCVVIFLSNFLALLIKVDAGEKSNRDAFGVLLVTINVMLVLAVLVTSWFATQQSVDDSREDETSFAIAKTMLTAEQFAANSARLTRSGRITNPGAAASPRPYISRSDRGEVWRGSSTLRAIHRSTAAVATGEDARQGLAGDEGVNAANLERLQEQNDVREGSVTDRTLDGWQSFSSVLV